MYKRLSDFPALSSAAKSPTSRIENKMSLSKSLEIHHTVLSVLLTFTQGPFDLVST